jgi:hypothetical protein
VLHPTKGEGEHQKPKKSLKGPQLITATLLFCYPMLCAQAATASTTSSSFHKPLTAQSSSYDKTQQLPQQKTTPSLIQNLLGQTPNLSGMRFPFFNAPSSEQEYQDMLAKASATLAEAKAQLTKATTALNSAQALKVRNQSALDKAQDALDSAKAKFDTASDAVDTAQERVQEAQDALDTAKADLDTATEDMKDADASVSQQEQVRNDAQVALDTAQTNLTSATSNLQTAQNTRALAQANVATKQSTYTQAQQATLSAQSALQVAQANYDNSQVPNPNYVAPSYTTQPTSYQIPDNNFMTGQPWIGDGSGSQGQPEVHPGHLHFSYIGTEVYQDILLYPRQIANYDFKVAIWNQDQNSVNQGAVTDTYGLRIYFYDSNNNLLHQESLTRTQAHGWQDVTLQGNTNTTTEVAKVRLGIYGIDNGFWAGTYGPAANNVRLTLGWITGTTQGSTTTGTLPVQINEGGMATFTAPNGGIFVSSNLRYEAIDDPTCGANVTPQGFGSNTITLSADNGVWGDTCGGWYKHLVGTLTYSTAQPQYIKDPSLLLVVQSSEANLTSAQQAEQSAQQNLAAAMAAASTSNEAAQDKEDELTAAQTSYEEALATFTAEEADLTNLENTSNIKRTSYEASLEVYETAGSNFKAAQESFDEVSSDVDSTKGDYDSALENFQEAETTFNDSDADLTSAQTDVEKAQDEVDIAQDELDSIPEYEPKEPEAPEIPEGDPRELTEEQVNELVTKAEAVLESAEQGSPAYEQALEALAVAADADDPQVPTELLAVPLVGEAAAAVLEAFNDLGNVGADMAPAVREEAEKTIIASVIATGAAVQAVQAAAASAASAAAASAGSSGASGSTRKIN